MRQRWQNFNLRLLWFNGNRH